MFRYRPEIDGLRTVAVLPVVLFHAGLGCPGGYVGVDVFFVISGFLISSLICKDLEAGDFCMRHFWERRVRRILPAVAVVTVATLVAGWFLLVPTHYEELGHSAIAQSLLAANFYFWDNSGYFDTAAELQPLLHTWSLAVEEQFYLVFPILLVLLWKRGRSFALRCSVVLAVLSFVWSAYAVERYPTATFFLLPARSWELLLGVMLALSSRAAPSARWVREVLSWGGLAAIFVPVFTYDLNTTFPGVAALPPCLGAAMIIHANGRGLTSLGQLLAIRPSVFIGKISYSLYLWHWPLIVYVKYASFEEPSLAVRWGLVLASVGLAAASWKWVESPFRKPGLLANRRQVFGMAAVVTVVLLIGSAAVMVSKGIPGRWSEDVLKYARAADERGYRGPGIMTDLVESREFPVLGEPRLDGVAPNTLIWGDSHVICVSDMLDALCTELGMQAYITAKPGTAPVSGTWRARRGAEDVAYPETVMELIREKEIKNLILVARWSVGVLGRPNGSMDTLLIDEESKGVTPAESQAAFERRFGPMIRGLREQGVRIWIMKQVPVQRHSVPEALARAVSAGHDPLRLGVSLKEHQERQAFVESVFREISGEGVSLLDPAPLLAHADGFYPMADEERALYIDDNHLSQYGGGLLRPLFEPVLQGIADAQKQ